MTAMASSTCSAPDDRDRPAFLGKGLHEFIERIPEPALILVPGGRIVAVNQAAVRISDMQLVGMTLAELIGCGDVRRAADGSPLVEGGAPYARALRGEYVTRGERFDGTLPDGSVYQALATSIPILVEGTVVAALSVWHDFDEGSSGPTEQTESEDAGSTPGGR